MKRPPAHCETGPAAPRRLGGLLLEVVAAVALFGIVMAIAVPVIASVSAIREQTQRRQAAHLELANVMDRIAARHRSGDPVSAAVQGIEISPELAALVPDAALTIDVADDESPQNRRVTAKLQWMETSGRPAAPLELTAYFVDQSVPEAAP